MNFHFLFFKQVKRVSQSVPRKVDQSKTKKGMVPNSYNKSTNKSSGKSTADENQPTFKTGVVVALATDGRKQTGNQLQQGGNQPRQLEMEHSQSKSLIQTAVTQSKFMSDETTMADSYKGKNVSDVFSRLHPKNELLVSEIFKQIKQTQVDDPPSYQEVVGSSSKKPKLSIDPCITYEV